MKMISIFFSDFAFFLLVVPIFTLGIFGCSEKDSKTNATATPDNGSTGGIPCVVDNMCYPECKNDPDCDSLDVGDPGEVAEKPNCKVEETSVTWEFVSGSCKNGLADGQGKAVSPDGRTYEGSFQKGIFHGKGTYTIPNGIKYVGQWKDGERDGQGTHTFPDSSKYVGEW